MRRPALALTLPVTALALACSKPAPPAPPPAPVAPAPVSEPVAGPIRAEVTFLHGDGSTDVVRAEVAVSAVDRARGLMGRRDLAEGRGMLFVFQRAEPHAFYMKNTLLPLDILFLSAAAGEAQVVGILENMRPLDERPRQVDVPSVAALEVPGGWARAHGVSVGAHCLIAPVKQETEAAAR